MKLFELNFTLLREFEELEGLFDLFNQMVIVKGNRLSVSVKSEKDVNFVEIYLYRSSEIPFIGIIRDLESSPSKETLDFLNKIDFEGVFLKFNIKNSKYVSIDVFDSAYEYGSQNEKVSNITDFNDNNVEELFALNFKICEPFPQVTDFLCILNSMLANNCCSFVALGNRYLASVCNSDKKSFTLNFFTNDISRPSLLFNANLQGKFNSGNITKYNMLCSQPGNPVHVCVDLKKMDKHHCPIVTAHIYLDKSSDSYNKIIDQCRLIDYVTTP